MCIFFGYFHNESPIQDRKRLFDIYQRRESGGKVFEIPEEWSNVEIIVLLGVQGNRNNRVGATGIGDDLFCKVDI